VADGRFAILRIRKQDRDHLEKHLFQRYPNREWGAFLRFGYRRTSWGIALSYVDAIPPQAGDLDRQSGATVFADQYTLRAMRTAEKRELAIGVSHSHPEGYFVQPSKYDDDMDLYFAQEVARYGAGMPYLSLIVQRSPSHGFTFSGRVHDRGQWFPLTTLLTVGDQLESECAEDLTLNPEGTSLVVTLESTTARLEQLLGVLSAARLQRARVGVIGCSGTGSPAIEVLARAGVGSFVLVDPQRIAPSNLERMHGMFFDDLANDPLPYKVAVLRRHILSINPQASVTALVGNLLHENVLDELLRCDALLGCTDSVHARVAMSDFAKHYLLPSIDVGVEMNGDHGRVTNQVTGVTHFKPDGPCAICDGLIDASDMADELMTDEERSHRQQQAEEAKTRGDDPGRYWRGVRQIHTVGYLTGMTGSLAAGYMEGWLTGAFSIPHPSFQFDISRPQFGFASTSASECPCRSHVGWSDQARTFRNVARPSHWTTRALLLSR
jgi:hypothetical protein